MCPTLAYELDTHTAILYDPLYIFLNKHRVSDQLCTILLSLLQTNRLISPAHLVTKQLTIIAHYIKNPLRRTIFPIEKLSETDFSHTIIGSYKITELWKYFGKKNCKKTLTF